MNLSDITVKVRKSLPEATEQQVSNVLKKMNRGFSDIKDNHIPAIVAEIKKSLESQISPVSTEVVSVDADPANPEKAETSAIAPIAPVAPQQAAPESVQLAKVEVKSRAAASTKFQETQDRKSENVAELMTNSDNGLSEVMEAAQKELAQRRAAKKLAKAKAIADLLEDDEDAEFEEFKAFLSRNVRGQNSALREQMQAAIDAVEVLEVEVV